jgi:hypothetical protein
MNKNRIYKFSRISEVCKYVVWIVVLNTGGTTNPMSKRRAMRIFKKELEKGDKTYLIRMYSSVSAKNHDKNRDFECGKTQKIKR